MARKKSRSFLSAMVLLILLAAFSFAFWPRPSLVDLGRVETAPMRVTIDEQGRTRVREAYVISTPRAGRLLRVEVDPGDVVEQGETVLARMRPAHPAALDWRSREQAGAAVNAAEAGLRLARADFERAIADRALAHSERERVRVLQGRDAVSRSALDRATRELRAAEAARASAAAAIQMSQAELEMARAQLLEFDHPPPAGDRGLKALQADEIALHPPIDGRVLRIMQQSETTLPAGAPIMEIGDIDSDLEVLVELLSTDAVQVQAGDRVLIRSWGGQGALSAVVERVEPWGFTKFSALGVEEQRVNTIIRLTDAEAAQAGLGHGFRVEAQIVVWEQDDALVAPSSALFRDGPDWAVFVVEEGVAKMRPVRIGHDNGTQAEVVQGLGVGDRLVLYPAADLIDGQRVTQRKTP